VLRLKQPELPFTGPTTASVRQTPLPAQDDGCFDIAFIIARFSQVETMVPKMKLSRACRSLRPASKVDFHQQENHRALTSSRVARCNIRPASNSPKA
jgi:hypothetical protein